MSKYCPMCDQVTNCTDNCKYCLEEEAQESTKDDMLYEDLRLEQLEQM